MFFGGWGFVAGVVAGHRHNLPGRIFELWEPTTQNSGNRDHASPKQTLAQLSVPKLELSSSVLVLADAEGRPQDGKGPGLCPHDLACDGTPCPWGVEIHGVAAEEGTSGECRDRFGEPCWVLSGVGILQSFQRRTMCWARRGRGMPSDWRTFFWLADA